MNRYAAAGIAQDAQDGRRVLVVAHDRHHAQKAFAVITALTHGADRIIRAYGVERIEHRNGGCVRFITPRSAGRRGFAADVIYVDGVDLTPDQLAELMPCLATSRDGELIRA